MKKIFDIIPPKETRSSTQSVECSVLEKDFRPSFNKRAICIIVSLIGALIMSVWVCYLTLGSAEIEILPEIRTPNFQEEIIIDGNISSSNFSQNIILGEVLSIEKEISQQFESTGSVLKKSKGIIRIYNAYSTYSQPLVATTRFVSASGKLFRTPKRIVIPGGHYEKRKLVPGYIDIEIIADQPGEDYNIEPTTFSIPGFAGTSKYTLFYAKSFSKMAGGGEFPQVTEQDLEQAKNILLEKVKQEGEKGLRQKASKDDFVLLDNAMSQEIVENSSLVKPGAEISHFNYKVKGIFTALVFSEHNLKNFAEHFISSKISEDEKLYFPSLETNYSLISIDTEHNKISLILEFLGKVYYDIETTSLKRALSEKSFDEAKTLLENKPNISKFQIKLWPFWVKKVPQDLEKIDIKLNLD